MNQSLYWMTSSCQGSHNRQDSRNCSRTRDWDDWCAWSIAARIPSTFWIRPGRKISDSWSSQKRSSPSLDGLLARLGQSRYWKPLAWASNHERLFFFCIGSINLVKSLLPWRITSQVLVDIETPTFTLVFFFNFFILFQWHLRYILDKHDALTYLTWNDHLGLRNIGIQISYHL